MLSQTSFVTHWGSRSFLEASQKSKLLYRQALREVPKIIRFYNIDLTVQEARTKIRQDFQKYSAIRDPQIIDLLVFKGTSELQEAVLFWKTKSHIMQFFDPEMPETPGFEASSFAQPPSVTTRNNHKANEETRFLKEFLADADPETPL